MHHLGAGKAAFLEFLRNLTPAILMASISFLMWFQLDFRRFDLSNWAYTMAFYICAFTAVLAFLANMSAFLDNAFIPPLALNRALRRFKLRGHSNWKVVRAMVGLIWRIKPMVFLEVVVAVVVVYAALFVGAMSAMSTAATALRNGLR